MSIADPEFPYSRFVDTPNRRHMSRAPSVLVLDDGDLLQVRSALMRLGADFVHLQGKQIGSVVTEPRDLLVTNWRCVHRLPKLEPAQGESSDPLWVCVHSEDFEPVRERLRSLGTHYLVHSGIDVSSLALLFGQLLHRGAEKRGAPRLPFGCEATYRVGGESRKAVLADLSMDGCRIIASQDVPPDAPLALDLPRELSGGARIEFPGRAVRSTPYEPLSQAPGHSIVIMFERLEPEAKTQLNVLLAGDQLGAPVASLERALDLVDVVGAEEVPVERRRHARREYQRQLTAISLLEDDAHQIVLGSDLSLEGIRIASRPGLTLGSPLRLALYGRPREEPLLIEAEVVHDYGEQGLGLSFIMPTEEQTQQLENLIAQLPPLEALRDDRPDGQCLVVSRLLPSAR